MERLMTALLELTLPMALVIAVLLAAGLVLTTQVHSEWGLIMALGVLSAAGAGGGSFSILIGATAQRIAPEQRSFAGGVINAGGSMGQFIFAPLNQAVMSAFGWMQAMWMMAVVSLSTIPMAWWLRGKPHAPAQAQAQAQSHSMEKKQDAGAELGMGQQLRVALRNPLGWGR